MLIFCELPIKSIPSVMHEIFSQPYIFDAGVHMLVMENSKKNQKGDYAGLSIAFIYFN